MTPRRPKGSTSTETTTDGVAPFLPLPRSWDDYLGHLPSKHRHEIKRKARKLTEEAGPFRDRRPPTPDR